MALVHDFFSDIGEQWRCGGLRVAWQKGLDQIIGFREEVGGLVPFPSRLM